MAAFAHSSRDVLGLAPRRQFAGIRLGEDAAMARIERVLTHMRRAGRRAILIVDARCGEGRLLIRAARRAATLGFVAIDARGFDRAPERIAVARAAAAGDVADCRIRLTFAVRCGSAPPTLDDDEADLVLADPDDDPPSLERLVHPTGTVIAYE